MARTPLIAGNWKMNTTVAEAQELTGAMLAGLDQIPRVEKLLCPPFISLTCRSRVAQRQLCEAGRPEHAPRGQGRVHR